MPKMYYNISMEKKVGNNMNNIHHCYNPMQHAQAKASCKGRRQQKPKRQKQSWVIDKTKFKNSNTDNSKIRVAITLFIFFLFILMLLASNNITSGIISFLVVFAPALPFLILAFLISLLKK